ncbi:hypothetical protein HA402_011468 [Bradysia odoriphaga]|nr:hypothetical protein HA402_011468 [Bradysia odoriphaga]
MGWAYDLKTVPDEMVRRRVLRTGNGTHRYSEVEKMKNKTAKELETYTEKYNAEEEERRDHYWGWGDDDMLQEDINDIKINNPKNK